jgi:hypothetical protein
MSTSSVSTNSGAVALDSAMRRAIVCWSRVSSSIVVCPRPVPASPETTGAGTSRFFFSAGCSSAFSSLAGAASLALSPFCAAASTSDLTIRPPGPVPLSEPRSTPSSCAMRRATGEAFTRPLPSPCGSAAPSPSSSSCVATGAASRSRSSSPCSSPASSSSADSPPSSAPRPDSDSSSSVSSDDGSSASPPSSSEPSSPPSPILAIVAPTARVSPSWATILSVPA